MRLKPTEIDQWSFYDYKPAVSQMRTIQALPGWVPTDDRRRLVAYMVLASYTLNSSRVWLGEDLSEEDVNNRREYGDPATIVDTILSSLIGETQNIWVDGAVDEDPAIQSAVDQLTALEEWAEQENVLAKVIQSERNSITLGDGVLVLGWDEKLSRPRLRVYDPGFYFPVFDDSDDEFPSTHHIAYEFERKEGDKTVRFIRRITWQVVETEDERMLPWNDAPTNTTVIMSDGEWRMDNISFPSGIMDLGESAAVWRQEPTDLGIDFVPLIHVPNTLTSEFWGTSGLARVMQVLDDLVSTDTDLQAASATTGSPPIAIAGSSIPTDDQGRITTYGPGTVLKTGDGTATVIDTSASLSALLQYDKDLLTRLSVNSRIPESLLGRVKPNEVPSGIALTLSFTPHSNLIKEMRLVRKQKYSLLMRFASRFMLMNGDIAEVHPARIVFGSFLPADKEEASNLVSTLAREDSPLISLQTGVEMLIKAGFPIDDAAKEVERIRQYDFATANKLLDATGDPALVLAFLGMRSTVSADTQPVPLADDQAQDALPPPQV